MLINNLYTIESISNTGNTTKATILLDKTHDIFGGHFPGFPVLPGVCMMQIVKEIVESKENRLLELKSSGILKFLSLLNPLNHVKVEVEVSVERQEDKSIKVEGSLATVDGVFFKINKAIYC